MRQPASHYADTLYDEREDDYGPVGEARPEEYPRRDRRLPAILLSLAVMALFAGALWFAYQQGTRHAPAAAAQRGGVPLIRADERPTKVKPDQPGGMKIPDQNVSLYNDNPGGATVEKLLPQPEQPMPRPAPAVEPPPSSAPAAAAPASAQPAAAAPPVAAPELPQPAAKAAAEPKPSPAKTAARPAPVAAEPAPGGRIQVRLASVRSADAARQEWARLKQQNADLLGKLSAVAVRADLGDRGIYYRVEAGPFADAAAAERLCAELKRRNHGCILAR